MDEGANEFRPESDADWERLRPDFTRLYIDEGLPLPKVMNIMKDRYGVKASAKMYKVRIKIWNLNKYCKPEVGKAVLDGESHEIQKRSIRSMKRKRDRQRAQSQSSNAYISTYSSPSKIADLDTGYLTPVSRSPKENHLALPQHVQSHRLLERFLSNLRTWVHVAFVSGHWDTGPISQPPSGSQTYLTVCSYINAGGKLFNSKKESLAWACWARASDRLMTSDFFRNWGRETPIRFLYETGRLHHRGHGELAKSLLRFAKAGANIVLAKNDPMLALFNDLGDADVTQLREMHCLATRVLYSDLESRIDKGSPVLCELRLDTTLELLWYDGDSDLKAWLPQIEEVDQSCGPNSSYSLYFLLLDAYRLVAQKLYARANLACSEARLRVAEMQKGAINLTRLGMAFRRVGQQQNSESRYMDAHRSFDTAWDYLSHDRQIPTLTTLVEIARFQEELTNTLEDPSDAKFWSQRRQGVERELEDQILTEPSSSNNHSSGMLSFGHLKSKVGKAQSPKMLDEKANLSARRLKAVQKPELPKLPASPDKRKDDSLSPGSSVVKSEETSSFSLKSWGHIGEDDQSTTATSCDLYINSDNADQSEGEISFIDGNNDSNVDMCESDASFLEELVQKIVAKYLKQSQTAGIVNRPLSGNSTLASQAGAMVRFQGSSGSSSRKRSHSEREDPNDLDRDQDDETRVQAKRARGKTQQCNRLFACPYWKNNPERYSERNIVERDYRGCSSKYLKDISRLKQHLYRVHKRPQFYCSICFASFATRDPLDAHLRQRDCEERAPRFQEKMSEAQVASIKPKVKNENPRVAWYRIFRILFPGAPEPASPYANEDVTVGHFAEFFRWVGPEVFANMMRARMDQGAPPLQLSTRVIAVEAFERALPNVLGTEGLFEERQQGSGESQSSDSSADSRPQQADEGHSLMMSNAISSPNQSSATLEPSDGEHSRPALEGSEDESVTPLEAHRAWEYDTMLASSGWSEYSNFEDVEDCFDIFGFQPSD